MKNLLNLLGSTALLAISLFSLNAEDISQINKNETTQNSIESLIQDQTLAKARYSNNESVKKHYPNTWKPYIAPCNYSQPSKYAVRAKLRCPESPK